MGGKIELPSTEEKCCGVGIVDGLLGLGGLAALVVGASFVKGAIDEREPVAAQRGAMVFGGLGSALLALAVIVRRISQK